MIWHDIIFIYIYVCMYLVLIAVGVMESDARYNVYTNSVCMYSKLMLFWSMISINVMCLDKVSINHMNFTRLSFLYSSKHWILTCNPHPCSMYMFSNVNPGLINPLPPALHQKVQKIFNRFWSDQSPPNKETSRDNWTNVPYSARKLVWLANFKMGGSNWVGFVAYPCKLGGKFGRIQKTSPLAKRVTLIRRG